MKRWRLIIGLVVALSVAIAVRHVYKAEAQKKRAAANQASLLTYSQSLKPGMTRKQVEDYLHSRGAAFKRSCCIEQQQGAFEDLIKVSEEEAPWGCSEWTVYVALVFGDPSAHGPPVQVSDSDVLSKVELVDLGGGCL